MPIRNVLWTSQHERPKLRSKINVAVDALLAIVFIAWLAEGALALGVVALAAAFAAILLVVSYVSYVGGYRGARRFTTKRRAPDDWIAYPTGRPSLWESGRTEAEALGKLAITLREAA